MNIPRIFFLVAIGALFKISESELGFSRNKKLRASTEMTFLMEVQKPFDCYPQRMNSFKHNQQRLGLFPSCDEVSCKQLSNRTKEESNQSRVSTRLERNRLVLLYHSSLVVCLFCFKIRSVVFAS